MNVKRPKKFILAHNISEICNAEIKSEVATIFHLIYGFLLAQTYTSMMVKAWPRKSRFTKKAKVIMEMAPKRNIMTKSEDFPRKLPSSSILETM